MVSLLLPDHQVGPFFVGKISNKMGACSFYMKFVRTWLIIIKQICTYI